MFLLENVFVEVFGYNDFACGVVPCEDSDLIFNFNACVEARMIFVCGGQWEFNKM